VLCLVAALRGLTLSDTLPSALRGVIVGVVVIAVMSEVRSLFARLTLLSVSTFNVGVTLYNLTLPGRIIRQVYIYKILDCLRSYTFNAITAIGMC